MADRPESIVRRRVDIAWDSAPDEPWFPLSETIERMLNTVSLFFPPGEAYFMESVRRFQGTVTDPVLKEQVQRFLFQEAMHTGQHRVANRFLARYYPNAPWVETLARRHLKFWHWLVPAGASLAATCAIEHLTAIAARTLLQHQELLQPWVQTGFYRLWMWHAVEESEHKSVCFDVYKAAFGDTDGGYVIRCAVMAVTTVLFFTTLVVGMVLLGRRPPLRRPPAPDWAPPDWESLEGTPRAEAAADRFLRGGLLSLVRQITPWRHYFAYFRRDFHPSDFDCADLIEEWKRRNPGFGLREAAAAEVNPLAA
ncbi:MAG: metal-dependent hydrolase [Reyranellaceae bacterium]